MNLHIVIYLFINLSTYLIKYGDPVVDDLQEGGGVVQGGAQGAGRPWTSGQDVQVCVNTI